MFKILIIPVFLLILVVILYFYVLTVTIHISYRLQLFDTHFLRMEIRYFGVKVWSKSIHLPRHLDGVEHFSVCSITSKWKKIAALLERMKVKHLHWETGLGMGEAHITAHLAGVVWMGKELSIKFLESCTAAVKDSRFTVKPNYQGEGFYSRLDLETKMDLRTWRKIRLFIKQSGRK